MKKQLQKLNENLKKIKQAAEQQKNKDQRFQETLRQTERTNKDSTPHTIFRKAKLVCVRDHRTSEQHITVTLRPVLSNDETASTKFKNEQPGE